MKLVIYAYAVVIELALITNTRLSNYFLDTILLISGALVLLGVVAAVVVLLWRRVRIWRNRNSYKD